jgi:hypothetical protein
MKVTIAPLEPKHYDAWNAVCRESKEAWFWHTTKWLEYTLAYNPSLESKSCCFLLYENSVPVAIVPLLVERCHHRDVITREFSFGGGWLPSPVCIDRLSPKENKHVYRAVFDEIFALARAEGVSRISFRSNPFSHLGSGPEGLISPTVCCGFTAYILPTQIMDVQKPPSDLLTEMRKGHRSNIRRAEKVLEGVVISQENASPELFASYQELHLKAAGRQTRPAETFEMMYDWIQNGYAILVGALLDGIPVSFAYVNIFKNCAYYGSACNDPEIKNLPLAHFVQWQILNWLHEHAFRHYEVGWQFYSDTEFLPASEKEIAISHFKRGFGGVTVPIIVSETFLSRQDYIAVSEERTSRFAQTLAEPAEHSAQSTQATAP